MVEMITSETSHADPSPARPEREWARRQIEKRRKPSALAVGFDHRSRC